VAKPQKYGERERQVTEQNRRKKKEESERYIH